MCDQRLTARERERERESAERGLDEAPLLSMIYNKVRAGVRGCGEAATVRLIDNLGWGESRDAARADGVVGTCRCRVSVVGIRGVYCRL